MLVVFVPDVNYLSGMLFVPGTIDDGLAFWVEQTAITCYYLSGMLFVPGAVNDRLAFLVKQTAVTCHYLS